MLSDWNVTGQVLVGNQAKAREIVNRSRDFDLNNVVVVYKDEPDEVRLISVSDTVETRSSGERTEIADLYITGEIDPDLFEIQQKKSRLEQKIYDLLEDESVLHVQPQYIYHTNSWGRSGSQDTPDDFDTISPTTGEHWYYEMAHLREMWQDQDCFGSGPNCGGNTGGVVAVIDTGLAYETRKSAWQDNFAKNDDMFNGTSITLYTNAGEIPNNLIDDDGNGYRDDYNGFNADDYVFCLPPEPQDPPCTTAEWAEEGHAYDDDGHGTYTTSMIASLVDNTFGSVSPGFNLTIMPIKASDFHSPSFGTAELVAAIDYAMNNGADVINMSLGGPTDDPVLSAKIDEAVAAGVFVVAASGNGGGAVEYPAANTGTFAVGAVAADDARACYSSFGAELDMVAYVGDGDGSCPISVIGEGTAAYQRTYSCFFTSPDCNDLGGSEDYETFSTSYSLGTSFAAPQVSAMAGILRAIGPSTPVSELESILIGNATDLGPAGFDTATGYGVLDWEATFAAAIASEAPTLSVIEPNGVGDGADASFNITWTDTDSDNDAAINFYYDLDSSGEDGTLIADCSNISEDDETDSCTWDMRFMPEDDYYIYGCIADFFNPVDCNNYGAGPITLTHAVKRDWNTHTVTTSWRTISFTTSFDTVPIVSAQITSEWGRDRIYLDVKDVTISGFSTRIRENTVTGWNGGHGSEELSWYAVQSTSAGEIVGQIDLTGPGWTSVTFPQAFGSTPHVFANLQTQNDTAIAYVDLRNITTTGFEARIEEPTGLANDHATETVGWVAFSDHPDAEEGSVIANHVRKTVTYATSFTAPPVLLAQIQTNNDGRRSTVDVGGTKDYRSRLWVGEDTKVHDGIHDNETISWAAFPYTPPNDVGVAQSLTDDWTEYPFDQPFEDTPKMFADINSENGTDTVDVDLRKITRRSFQARIEEDPKAGWNNKHMDEDITWYAFYIRPTGSKNGNLTTNQNWTNSGIGGGGFGSTPMVFAEIQTDNGGDTAAVDVKAITPTGMKLRVEEDKVAGHNGNHTNETISWWGFTSAPFGQAGLDSVDHNWKTVTFPIAFSTVPKLLFEVNSENGGQTAMVDVRNITTADFEVRVEEEPKRYDGSHAFEDVVWLAWE